MGCVIFAPYTSYNPLRYVEWHVFACPRTTRQQALKCEEFGTMRRESGQYSQGRVYCTAKDGFVCPLAASELSKSVESV